MRRRVTLSADKGAFNYTHSFNTLIKSVGKLNLKNYGMKISIYVKYEYVEACLSPLIEVYLSAVQWYGSGGYINKVLAAVPVCLILDRHSSYQAILYRNHNYTSILFLALLL